MYLVTSVLVTGRAGRTTLPCSIKGDAVNSNSDYFNYGIKKIKKRESDKEINREIEKR